MTVQFYVAPLADYNAGRLHGRWIDAALDVDDIQAEIAEMLAQSREPFAEAWAVHDYDGLPSSLGEYPELEQIVSIARGIEEHGDAFRAYAACFDTDTVSSADFSDRYVGEFATQADFAADLLESRGDLDEMPEHMRNYIDYDAYGRDCLLGGDVCRCGDHWFWNA